jgi:hypothetical protein
VRPVIAATIRALIERVARGESGEAFENAARRFNALPLAEGWFAWALLTEQGDVLEATEDGTVSHAVEPLRTMFLVAGTERYPELIVLLPERSDSCIDCARCEGTGRMPYGGKKIRCHECRALGWVAGPSNTSA